MSLDMTMNILIVDDSGTMRMMCKKMLKEGGFENLFTAVNGVDAQSKLQEHEIDLIISDWNMPGMDGLELLQWLRREEKYKDIPFIMATAQADKTQQKKIMDEGGDNHIAKPFDSKQLKDNILETFGLKKGRETEKRIRKAVNGKVQMKVGHIQITDHLILGVLKHQIETGEVTPQYFELEALCLPGWNPVQELLEKGDVDAAFILAPIAMDLYAFDIPIKLILLAHKNGSIFVRNKKIDIDDYGSLKKFYKYKVVDIPHKMSIHNMLAYKYLKELGLKPGVPGKKAINVRFEVVPPIKMPEIMKANEDIGGFIVAEPIGSNAISKGIAELEFFSSSIWQDHPCCVTAMRDDFIAEHPDAVYEFTSLLVKAGKFVKQNPEKAAEIAVAFLDPDKVLGLSSNILKNVLEAPQGITMDNLYPVLEDLDTIQRYMKEQMGIGCLIDVEKFVDLRFADEACGD